MARTLGAIALFGTLLGLAGPGSAGTTLGRTYLDNGVVRVGVGLDNGAKIDFVAAAVGASRNLVQDVQPSYSSGPYFERGYTGWHAFSTGALLLAHSNDGRTIYTKTRAANEAGGYCECFFEQWVRLRGRAILVHNRLTAFRSDTTRYRPNPQELPALYSTGTAYRLFTYDGPAPYRNGPLEEITSQAGSFFVPGPNWRATEHWAALVDDSGFGIGLVKQDLVRFAGTPGTRDAIPKDWVNGYLTSATAESVDANATYSYDYTLVVGTLRDIRSYAYSHRADPRPEYRFRWDRQHWTVWNATDRGFPIRGALQVLPTQDDPQLVGPEGWWSARQVPVLYVRGRWASAQHVAELFWSTADTGFTENHKALIATSNDDRFHTYKVRLAGLTGWSGAITQLRLDPVYAAEPGAEIDVTCVSFRPCPVDRRAEARLEEAGAVPYLDSFDGTTLDPAFWQEVRGGSGPTATQDGELEIVVPGTSAIDPLSGSLWEGVLSRCTLLGDFDVQVDYRLLDWPASNGVHLNLGTNWPQAVGRQNVGGELVFAWFPPDVVNDPFSDLAGSLRLVQRGSTITGYVRHDGEWIALLTARTTHTESAIQLTVSAQGNEFSDQTVQVAFDNFRINSGRLVC